VLERLSHVEQPVAREKTLDARFAPGRALAARVALVIDEADGGALAFPRAAALGYRGVSAKNCKGLFRSLANAALVAARGAASGLFLCAEDLTTLPVLALQQDLATVATLGLPHVERNGHHYFRGLAHLPPDEARDALAANPDLYDSSGLRVEAGRIAISSLARDPGLGHDLRIRVDERTPVAVISA